MASFNDKVSSAIRSQEQKGLTINESLSESQKNVATLKRQYNLVSRDYQNILNEQELQKSYYQEVKSSFRFEEKTVTLRRGTEKNYKINKTSITNLRESKHLKSKSSLTKKTQKLKKEYEVKKTNLQVARKVLQHNKRNKTKKRNQDITRNSMQLAHRTGSEIVDSTLEQDDDVLSDIAKGRKKSKNLSRTVNQVKRVGSLPKRKGWLRRPSTIDNLESMKKLRQFQNRLRNSKLGKQAIKGLKIFTKLFATIGSFLSNPLSSVSILIMGGLVIFLSYFVVATSSPVTQSEFDTNDAWIYLSKIDREKSNDDVDYWTDNDSIISFMGYKFGEWELKKEVDDKGILDFSDKGDKTLSKIWDLLNKDKDSLKSMEDVYSDSSNKEYKLDKDEIEEYKEITENSTEVGKYFTSNELTSFFNAPSSSDENDELVVTKRFGYISKDEMYNGSVLQAEKGKNIYAPMTGKIDVTKKDIEIKDKDTKLVLKNIDELRYKDNQTINEGDLIGKVGSEDGQEVFLSRFNDNKTDFSSKIDSKTKTKTSSSSKTDSKTKTDSEKGVWEYVNVGFYYPNVKYNQTTSVMEDISFEGSVGNKIFDAYSALKRFNKKTTMNGASAMFGNFLTESNMNPKRAEGDYLSPPIGASGDSWDKDSWLNIGGTQIYNGRYPNILHRGLGLGQWTDTADGANRATLLREYAKKKNKKWYALELQLDFIFNGDNPYYREIANEILTSNDSVEVLTTRFLNRWEGNSGDKLAQRQDSAKQVLAELKNGGGGSSKISGDFAHIFKVPYTVVQPYGKTPWSQGGGAWMYPMGRHSGVDLQGQGSRVSMYSATDGKVQQVNHDPMGGYFIIIKPPFEGILYYGHMADTSVKVGQSLKKGTKIGIMGSGGGVLHVHFEWNKDVRTLGRANSQDVDPSRIVQKSGTLKQNQVIKP